jgi:hypothetical protein
MFVGACASSLGVNRLDRSRMTELGNVSYNLHTMCLVQEF